MYVATPVMSFSLLFLARKNASAVSPGTVVEAVVVVGVAGEWGEGE